MNKKSKSSTKSKSKTSSAGAKARKQVAAGKRTRAKGVARQADTTAGRSLKRLPDVGTVIKKVDRYGDVRCECTITQGGVEYNGKVYRSISAAAMAAARDLGLENKTQNGYTFWGLEPARTSNLVAAMGLKGRRFQEAAGAAVSGVTAENREQLRAELTKHRESLDSLLAQVAS
jgi:hypothetical protein